MITNYNQENIQIRVFVPRDSYSKLSKYKNKSQVVRNALKHYLKHLEEKKKC